MVPVRAPDDVDNGAKLDISIKFEAKEENGVEREANGLVTGPPCADNYKDREICSDSEPTRLDDMLVLEVDVLACKDDGAAEPSQAEDPDATEHSSSFGDTFSGCDDSERMGSSNEEVVSRLNGEDGGLATCDGYNRVFRKKRLTTAHWRRFIRPLMWRCHWIELRLKELKSQTSVYDKELAMYMREKQSHSEMVESDRTASRSIPFTYHRKQSMKRRKRKRKEDIVDISSYMSHHNIFSYYENKRSETDGHSVDDDCGDQADDDTKGPNDLGVNSGWPMLGSRAADSALEQILFTVESVQSRVIKLKTHLNKVMSRNTKEISSTQCNFVHGGPPVSIPMSPSCSPQNNGDAIPVGALNASPHHMSEYEMEIPVMAGSTVSSYGDAAEVAIGESTFGLLSSGDGHPDPHEIGAFCKDNADDVLINNKAAEQELQDFEKVSHAMEKPLEVAKEEVESSFEDESNAPKVSVYEIGLPREKGDMIQQQQPALKPCYTGKRRGRKPKRKRRGGFTTGSGSLKSGKYQKRRLA